MGIHHTVEDKYCYSKIADTMLETFPEVREQYAKELRGSAILFRDKKLEARVSILIAVSVISLAACWQRKSQTIDGWKEYLTF